MVLSRLLPIGLERKALVSELMSKAVGISNIPN